MKRILLSATILLAVGAFLFVTVGASSSSNSSPTFKIEFDNAFGLVNNADFKVAGVRAGSIKSIDLCQAVPDSHCQNPLDAIVTVQVTEKGFGSFHRDVFCKSRPQSLIGEYFVECEPGQAGPVLKSGSTIPVTHTQSTIAADLLNDIMRLPYRERLTLIINELGAAAAGRSGDLKAALRRAVPALTQTDNLLNLLANDSRTLQQLTVNSDSVITALANNSANVQRFIIEANKAASDTATQQQNLRLTWQNLPGFLEQLRPAMAQLGTTVTTNEPVLRNLTAAGANLHRLFTDIASCSSPHADSQCGFAQASLPALRSLGTASVTGRTAVTAAQPTIRDLNRFTGSIGCSGKTLTCTPELAKNLAIVLHDLDNRSRAVEADKRSPTGRGYTGLEALLQYVFNQTLAINQFGQFGHLLTVDAFIDPRCASYATPSSVAQSLKTYGPAYRQCYAWLGPNQPGINEADPSCTRANGCTNRCVPDPGGAPPGYRGPSTSACKLPASDVSASTANSKSTRHGASGKSASAAGGGRSSPSASRTSRAGPGATIQGTLSQILSAFGAGSTSSPAPAASTSTGSGAAGSAGGQAQQLLNYLLAP